jgi:hypothetical protein
MDNTSENSLPNLELDFDQDLCQETQEQEMKSENEENAEIYQPQTDICNLKCEIQSESERVDTYLKVDNFEDDLQDKNVLDFTENIVQNKEILDCDG